MNTPMLSVDEIMGNRLVFVIDENDGLLDVPLNNYPVLPIEKDELPAITADNVGIHIQ